MVLGALGGMSHIPNNGICRQSERESELRETQAWKEWETAEKTEKEMEERQR